MLSIFVILAIIISIFLGYKTKINTGLFAMGFAYIIGCFVLGLSAKEVIQTWPISIFFVIMSVSIFYNFALINGTLEKISNNLLYRCRKFPSLLPLIIYFAAALVASLGAGFFTVMAFFTPITLLLCEKTKTNKLIGAIAVNYGALSGANFMVSASGIIFRELMIESGFNQDAFKFSTYIFVVSFIIPIIVISILILLTKKKSNISLDESIEKPEVFTKKQKQNLRLIVIMMTTILVFPILKNIFPENEYILFINSKIDIGLIAIIFSVIALLLDLGDQGKALEKVPWNTLIMICGVGMLIQVAIKAGTIDQLSTLIGKSESVYLVPFLMAVIGAFMSFFSSTLGVVCPAIFPIIPSIAESTGLSPALLFVALVIGAQSSAISPFSSGGSLVLGSMSNEEERNEMFPKLLFKAVPLCLVSALIAVYAVSLIL
ncbi:MAG: SLC13 family permease [Tissierellia bacterium]|nr:SLC13 family permease [Tissierellia bacterium]